MEPGWHASRMSLRTDGVTCKGEAIEVRPVARCALGSPCANVE